MSASITFHLFADDATPDFFTHGGERDVYFIRSTYHDESFTISGTTKDIQEFLDGFTRAALRTLRAAVDANQLVLVPQGGE